VPEKEVGAKSSYDELLGQTRASNEREQRTARDSHPPRGRKIASFQRGKEKNRRGGKGRVLEYVPGIHGVAGMERKIGDMGERSSKR